MARDLFHNAVRNALLKESWTITALQMTEPERVLYLAVPLEAFDSFFQERFVKEAIKLYQLQLVVYDPEQEVIDQWIN